MAETGSIDSWFKHNALLHERRREYARKHGKKEWGVLSTEF